MKTTGLTVFSILKLTSIAFLSVLPFIQLIVKGGYFAISDHIFPLFPDREVARCVSLWDESFLMGRLTTPIPLANLPQYLVYYVLASLLNVEVASRLFFPLIFVIAGFSMYFLSRYLVGGFIPCLVSVIIYIYNPWIINRVLSGHSFLLFAYALTPLMLTLYFKGVDRKSLKPALLSSFLLALIISISYHLAYIIIPIILIYPIFRVRLGRVRDVLSLYGLVALIIMSSMLLNSYWTTTFPMVLNTLGGTNIVDVENLSIESNIVNVLRLHGYFWNGWWNVFKSGLPKLIVDLWWFTSFLPFTLSILAIAFSRGSKIKLLTFMLIVYSVLAVGLNWPFSSLNRFLYENVPFYIIHRDPNKIVAALCLTYSMLAAYTTRWLLNLRWGRIAVAIIAMLLLFNAWPLLTGNLYGYFELLDFPRDYLQVDQWLQDQHGDFRVLWLPPIETGAYFTWRPRKEGIWGIWDPLKYTVLSKPSVGFTHIDEWFGGVRNTVWFLHFLYNKIYNGKLRDLNQLLNMINVKYIVFREDVVSAFCSGIFKDQNDFRRVKDDLDSMFKAVYQVGCLKVYEVPSYSTSSLSMVYDSLIVVGDLEALIMLSQIQDVRGKAVFFIDDLNLNDLFKILNYSNSVIFTFLDTGLEDAVLALLRDRYTLSSYAGNGWVQVVNEWYKDNLHAIVERGCLHRGLLYSSTPKSTVNIPLSINESNVYHLWVKAWLDSKPGVVEFYIDEFMIANISLYTNTPTFKYIPVSSIYLPAGSHSLKIVLRLGEAILGDLVLVGGNQLNQSLRKLGEIINSQKVTVINIHTSDTLRGILTKPTGNRKPLEILSYGEVKASATIYKPGLYNITINADGVYDVKVEINDTIRNGKYSILVNLDKGLYELKLYIKGNASVNYIAIAGVSSVKAKETQNPKFIKESTLKYSVNLNESCILIFKQSYSPLWLAYGKSIYEPIPTIMFNAYLTQEEVTIKLKIEEAYIAGIITSITTLIAITTILIKQYITKPHNSPEMGHHR